MYVFWVRCQHKILYTVLKSTKGQIQSSFLAFVPDFFFLLCASYFFFHFQFIAIFLYRFIFLCNLLLLLHFSIRLVQAIILYSAPFYSIFDLVLFFFVLIAQVCNAKMKDSIEEAFDVWYSINMGTYPNVYTHISMNILYTHTRFFSLLTFFYWRWTLYILTISIVERKKSSSFMLRSMGKKWFF